MDVAKGTTAAEVDEEAWDKGEVDEAPATTTDVDDASAEEGLSELDGVDRV